MTPEQALINLYNASRAVAANAETHEIFKQCLQILETAIKKSENKDAKID